MPALTLADVFAALGVPGRGVMIIHSSMDWMWRGGFQLDDVVATLTRWSDRGTLVVPTFPFVRAHEQYLRTRPHMDVRTTPTQAGLLNEFLRRLPGAVRSLDPDLTLSARGPDADHIIGDRPTGPDPHGPDSPYHRIVASGGCLVGLGVTANYMISTHAIDSRYRHRYGFPIYSSGTYPASSRGYDGTLHTMDKHAVLEAVETNIKPGRQVGLLPQGSDLFRSIEVGGCLFFRWSLPGWEEICVRHIEERLAAGGEPCWHEQVASKHRERLAGATLA